MKRLDRRPLVYSQQYALTNMGIPWSIHRLKKQAIAEAERNTGKPWSECRKYLEVRKVKLVEIE
jgi:hypothetical protein